MNFVWYFFGYIYTVRDVLKITTSWSFKFLNKQVLQWYHLSNRVWSSYLCYCSKFKFSMFPFFVLICKGYWWQKLKFFVHRRLLEPNYIALPIYNKIFLYFCIFLFIHGISDIKGRLMWNKKSLCFSLHLRVGGSARLIATQAPDCVTSS